MPNKLVRMICKAIVRTLQVCTAPPYGFGDEKAIQTATRSFDTTLDWITGKRSSLHKSSTPQQLARVRDFIRGADKGSDAMSWGDLLRHEGYRAGLDYLRAIDPALAFGSKQRQEAARQDLKKLRLTKWIRAIEGVISFFGALGTRDQDMPARYRRQFDLDDPTTGVKKLLLATQQGSFGATYGGVGKGPDARWPFSRRYRDYASVLMPATSALQRRADQDILFFAAYDPFLDGDSGLDLAYDAAANHGAYGFKYYPPSGSRAADNSIPPKPGKCHQQHAWRSRYEENGRILTGPDLDRRIAKFLDWAIASDVPVFTHSNPREFEAAPCYGYEFTHPVYWMKFLESSAQRGQLRLCLGHASGPDFWFGTCDSKRPTADWGPIAAYLAMKYPNVYLEVGIHDHVTDAKQRAHFQAVLETLEEIRVREELPHSIADKILYGTDWFMPIHVKRRKYLDDYVSTFAEMDALRVSGLKWSDRFFRTNALRYLNAEKRRSKGLRLARVSAQRDAKTVQLPTTVADDLAAMAVVK